MSHTAPPRSPIATSMKQIPEEKAYKQVGEDVRNESQSNSTDPKSPIVVVKKKKKPQTRTNGGRPLYKRVSLTHTYLPSKTSRAILAPSSKVTPVEKEEKRADESTLLSKPDFSKSRPDMQLVDKSSIGRCVDLSVRMLRIADLKEESHSYYCEFLLFLMWKDEKLIGRTQSEIDWSKEWRPKITVVNMISAVDDYFSPRSEASPVLINKNVGQVLFVTKINGTYSNCFDLHNFPFDMQKLTLVFRSKESFNKVYIRKMSNTRFASTVSKNFASSLSHWRVEKWAYEEAQIDNHSLNRPYATYKVTIFASRKPEYYFRKMLSVVLITTIMSFLGFCTPLSDIGSRLEFLVSILLTNIAFTFSVNQELPKIGYYTLLDIFVQASILAPFISGLLSVACYTIYREEVELCERKLGSQVDMGRIFDMHDDLTQFEDQDCDGSDVVDRFAFITIVLSYIAFWLWYAIKYRRILGVNSTYLKLARASWMNRQGNDAVKKEKHENFARYEITDFSDSHARFRFFTDGLNC